MCSVGAEGWTSKGSFPMVIPQTAPKDKARLHDDAKRKRERKIDGLDYYEFCELIRSSSL